MTKNGKGSIVNRGNADREILFSVTTSNGLVVETFRSGGKGGQNVNKVETGARIKHPESGAIGESTEERGQLLNKRIALKRMAATPQFKWWVARKVRELDGKQTPEQWVEAEMAQLDHFRVEYRDENGKWTVVE